MGIGSFFGHLGIIPGMITAAIKGESIGSGALKGLKGSIDALEVMAGAMTGNPLLIAKGTKGFIDDVQHDRKFDSESAARLLSGGNAFTSPDPELVSI